MTDSEPAADRLAAVVGKRVFELRTTKLLSQEDLTVKCERLGLSWTRSRMSEFERGKRGQLDIGELVVVALALSVPLRDLLASTGHVKLTKAGKPVDGRHILKFLDGEQGAEAVLEDALARMAIAEDPPDWLESDVARRWNTDAAYVHSLAFSLFGKGLRAERDARMAKIGDSASLQNQTARKGHVTRALETEVWEANTVKEGGGDNAEDA